MKTIEPRRLVELVNSGIEGEVIFKGHVTVESSSIGGLFFNYKGDLSLSARAGRGEYKVRSLSVHDGMVFDFRIREGSKAELENASRVCIPIDLTDTTTLYFSSLDTIKY